MNCLVEAIGGHGFNAGDGQEATKMRASIVKLFRTQAGELIVKLQMSYMKTIIDGCRSQNHCLENKSSFFENAILVFLMC